MNPVILLAGAALALVYFSKRKKEGDEPKGLGTGTPPTDEPGACLPLAAKKFADEIPNLLNPMQLMSLATVYRTQGHEAIADCLQDMAQGDAASCPGMDKPILDDLKKASPEALRQIADHFRILGPSMASVIQCLEATATELEQAAPPPEPGIGPDTVMA